MISPAFRSSGPRTLTRRRLEQVRGLALHAGLVRARQVKHTPV